VLDLIYTYAWNPDRQITEAERAKYEMGHSIIAEVGPDFVPLRNRRNDYLLDRDDQKHRSYTGIRGVAEQDQMIQESQGFIADRTRESLTPTDAGVVRFRRVIMKGATALAEGSEPEAPWRPQSYRLRSGSWIGPKTVPFEEVMVRRFGHPFGRTAV
jgi:phthalate 4,5-dioxygenase oxygenase subunit